MKLGRIDQSEVAFLGDNITKQVGRFSVQKESGCLVCLISRQHFAALGGEGQGEKILAFEDANTLGKTLEIGFK